MESDAATTGISRRSALKKLGAGAAVAWSAPALMSVTAVAVAGSNPCTTCAPLDPSNSPCGNGCGCATKQQGGCVCASEFGSCFHCQTDADCGSGFLCMQLGTTFQNACAGVGVTTTTGCVLPCAAPDPPFPPGTPTFGQRPPP